MAGALSLAVDEVNANQSLPQKLEYSWVDDTCTAAGALAALSKMIDDYKPDVVIGPGCSSACESTAFLTAGFGIPQISWGTLPRMHAPTRMYACAHASTHSAHTHSRMQVAPIDA